MIPQSKLFDSACCAASVSLTFEASLLFLNNCIIIEIVFPFSQNFYSQCFGDETLIMIKDSTPVNRKQLNPNKVKMRCASRHTSV